MSLKYPPNPEWTVRTVRNEDGTTTTTTAVRMEVRTVDDTGKVVETASLLRRRRAGSEASQPPASIAADAADCGDCEPTALEVEGPEGHQQVVAYSLESCDDEWCYYGSPGGVA
ncbi:hypothetical protein [Nocardia sp. CA-145437]|uniref:hypothetical protein n=1 Tax=Nocardia sp. CA-145437 TaxID=3239980 RepID=UPI003D97DB00